jgi:hypothetical protein
MMSNTPYHQDSYTPGACNDSVLAIRNKVAQIKYGNGKEGRLGDGAHIIFLLVPAPEDHASYSEHHLHPRIGVKCLVPSWLRNRCKQIPVLSQLQERWINSSLKLLTLPYFRLIMFSFHSRRVARGFRT